jgi:hypothetical protein
MTLKEIAQKKWAEKQLEKHVCLCSDCVNARSILLAIKD